MHVVGVLSDENMNAFVDEHSEVFLVNDGGLSNENMNASADDRAAHHKGKYFRKF